MEYIYSQESPAVLVVDDEQVIRDILCDFLSSEGFRVTAVSDGTEALSELNERTYDLMITDLKMPEMGGIELLAEVKEKNLSITTIIMTGFGTVETAIQAMKSGAYDYILKPFKVDEMLQVVKRALEKQRLERENIRLKGVMSLYNVSEAMNSSLSLDYILQIIMETTKSELEADAVSLVLEETPEDGGPTMEYMTHTLSELEDEDELLGQLDIKDLFEYFRDSPHLLASAPKAKKFFHKPPTRKGMSSFLSVALKSRDQVLGAINAYAYRKNYRFSEGQAKVLTILASRAAQAIENARLYENLQRTFRETIQGLVSTLEAKDKYTSGHSRRVTEFALKMAERLDLTPEELEKVEWAGLLHDIGKIGIRLEALNKPQKISREEHEMFKDHTVMGKQIIESIHFLRDIVPIVYHHHEWYDGSGYPEGIKGDDIPLGARILAVADSFDAMTSDRPYRKAMAEEDAIKEIKKFAGTQFDPSLAQLFVDTLEQGDNGKKSKSDPHRAKASAVS